MTYNLRGKEITLGITVFLESVLSSLQTTIRQKTSLCRCASPPGHATAAVNADCRLPVAC